MEFEVAMFRMTARPASALLNVLEHLAEGVKSHLSTVIDSTDASHDLSWRLPEAIVVNRSCEATTLTTRQ